MFPMSGIPDMIKIAGGREEAVKGMIIVGDLEISGKISQS